MTSAHAGVAPLHATQPPQLATVFGVTQTPPHAVCPVGQTMVGPSSPPSTSPSTPPSSPTEGAPSTPESSDCATSASGRTEASVFGCTLTTLASQSVLQSLKSLSPVMTPQALIAPPSATAPKIPRSQRTAIQLYSLPP